MENTLKTYRIITVDTQAVIEKDFFDENYGFRHIPVLMKNAFQHWLGSDNTTIQKPSYLDCWYQQYAPENAPMMPTITVETDNYFRKNIWDLNSWHFVTEGQINWLFFPPTVIEYLQLKATLSEASNEKGLPIDLVAIAEKYQIKPLAITQKQGELLFIPAQYAYTQQISEDAQLLSKTILTEYNHDNLYAYFRKTEHKALIKQTILEGFTNTKHLSIYETPIQRLSNQAAA